MKTVYDIQQYVKMFDTLIYTGDRLADLELLEAEMKEMFRSQLIGKREFENAMIILRYEIQLEREKREQKKNDE